VPTLLVTEPFFSVRVAVTAIVQGNVVVEPVVDSPVTMAAMSIIGSPMAEIDEEEEPSANHEEEQQQHPIHDVPHDEPPRRS
jgi:hypothetical protein